MSRIQKDPEEKDLKVKIISEIIDELAKLENSTSSEREICNIVAIKNGVNENTVRTWWRRSKSQKEKTHGNQLISDDEEKLLVGVLEGFSLSHSPISKQKLLEIVRLLFKLPAKWEGYGWYYRFISRHKDSLNSCTVQAIQSERVSTDVYSNTQVFASVYEKYLQDFHFTADTVVNADETRLSIKGNLFCSEYIESTQKKKNTHKQRKEKKTAGLLVFATASGKIIFSVYLIPADFNEKLQGTANLPIYNKPYLLKGDWERCYIFTETGYMNDDAWNNIIEKYSEVVSKLWGKVDSLLLLDKLSSHMQVKTVKR
jgi:hypothetical protein